MAELEIGIDPSRAERGGRSVEQALDRIKRSARSTVRSVEGLASGLSRQLLVARSSAGALGNTIKDVGKNIVGQFSSMRVAVAGFVAALGVGKIVGVISEYERLQAALVTVTGSQEEATQAFSALKTFAQETPFQLQEIVDGFIKLSSRGIKPTEETLRAFGNTASAMGKSLDQFIEAVADASTSEFERLKEFGIKASKQGDTVAFTFRGVTTEVQNNAQAIEGFLIGIGQTDFAGAMDLQMMTVGGLISNLKDQVSNLFAEFGEAGGSGVIKTVLQGLINLVQGLRNGIVAVQIATIRLAAGFDELKVRGTAAVLNLKDEIRQLFSFNDAEIQKSIDARNAAAEQQLGTIKRVAQETEDAIVEAALARGKLKGAEGEGEEQRLTKTQRDALSKQLTQLQDSLLSEEESIRQSFERRKMIVEQAAATGVLQGDPATILEKLKAQQGAELKALEEKNLVEIEMERNKLEQIKQLRIQKETETREALAEKLAEHSAFSKDTVNNLLQFETRTNKQRTKDGIGALTELTAAVGTQSKKGFELSKKLGIVQAVIDTQAAAVAAYKALAGIPIVGPALGAAAAAAAIAYGAQRVQSIKSQSFGGGGGSVSGGAAPSGGGVSSSASSAAQATQQQQAPQQPSGTVLNVDFQGESRERGPTREEFDRFIELYNEAVRDGTVVERINTV